MNGRLLLIPALLVALLSPLAHADLSETKENIKQDTKEAARRPAMRQRKPGTPQPTPHEQSGMA